MKSAPHRRLDRRVFPLLPVAVRPFRAVLAGRGVSALGDQAILSLGNFITNILLIRHLSLGHFGDFAVLFSVILFLNNVQGSLVTYPLSVMAGSEDDQRYRRRARAAVASTLVLALPFALIVSAVAGCLAGAATAAAVVAAMLLWQIQETLRRTLMARLEHHRAIVGDAISYLGQAVAVGVLARHGTLSVSGAFLIIAATSAAGALVQAWQLSLWKPTPKEDVTAVDSTWTAHARESWDLGRWVLLSNLVGLVTVYATPWLLRYFHGSGQVAAYQALSNLLGVSNPVVSSMAGLIVPAVATARAEHGLAAARRAASRYGLQGLVLLLPYYAALLLLPHLALRLFYGPGSPYAVYATPLRLFVLIYGLYYLSQIAFGLMNGLGKSQWSFYAQLCAAATNAGICLPLAVEVGLIGTVWGGVAPMLAQLIVAGYFLRQLFPPHKSFG